MSDYLCSTVYACREAVILPSQVQGEHIQANQPTKQDLGNPGFSQDEQTKQQALVLWELGLSCPGLIR